MQDVADFDPEKRLQRQLSDSAPALAGRIGVLLVNLGTPDGADYWSMRRYLKEFLSDRRVIDVNRFLWWPLLHFVILPLRPRRSGHAYEQIWDKERNESPLRSFTRAQAEKLSIRLSGVDDIIVDWAMRYGQPSINTVLKSLIDRNCTRILFFPLYPQYSAATTGSANDVIFNALLPMRWQPTLRTVPSYYEDHIYIDELAKSLKSSIATLDFEPERIIASFHGVPKSFLEKGDPYYCHCVKTADLLRETLGLTDETFILAFQSRFGREEWIQPYTDQMIKKLAIEGVKKIAVVMPGFVADCVETLEEIALQNGELFKQHGGTHFAAIPCLNDSVHGMNVIEHVVRRELAGWI